MKKMMAIFAILFLLGSCSSSQNGPPYIKEIAPLSEVPGLGVSFVIPDEPGWALFDPDGNGASILKSGDTKNESYVISLDRYQQLVPKTATEFRELYKVLEQREFAAPRYKPLVTQAQPSNSDNAFTLEFYYLAEDRQPNGLPVDHQYMFIEAMGKFVAHPHIPDTLVRIAYSHRYFSGHQDPEFKKKANWVLEHVILTKQ